jgi:hypothetical protein
LLNLESFSINKNFSYLLISCLLQGPYYHGSQFLPGGGHRYPQQPPLVVSSAGTASIPPYWTPQPEPRQMETNPLSVHQQRQQCIIVQV